MATDKTSNKSQTKSSSPQPADSSRGNSSPKRKYLKITGIVAAVLLVIFVLIGIFAETVPQYSTSDLVTQNEGKISYSRPAQWKDASNIEKVKKDIGLSVNNTSVFGDKIVKDKNGEQDVANAFVIFGEVSGSSPAKVALLKRPAVKAAFEKAMNSQLKQDNFKSDKCESIVNYSKNFNYGLNNFPVSVAINFNCQLSDAEKKNQNADSLEVRMAIVIANDGKTYVYALVADDKSWAKNEQVYFQMLRDFKSQP